MHGAPGLVKQILEPLDLLAQHIAFLAVTIAVPIGPFVVASQALDLPLLPLHLGEQRFELRDQRFTRRRAPSRLHAPVMARSENLYKYEILDRLGRRPLSGSMTR